MVTSVRRELNWLAINNDSLGDRRIFAGMLLMAWVLSLGAGVALAEAPLGPAFPQNSLSARGLLSQPEILPVDEAFVLSLNESDETLQIHWLIQPGYYLYKDKLFVEGLSGALSLPEGELKQDEIFGEVQVYHGELRIEVPVAAIDPRVTITLGYQGCATAGFCYPPQKRTINLNNL